MRSCTGQSSRHDCRDNWSSSETAKLELEKILEDLQVVQPGRNLRYLTGSNSLDSIASIVVSGICFNSVEPPV